MHTAYKVVTPYTDDTLQSLVAYGPWHVVYRPGEWIEPSVTGSLLFAFVNEDHAREYLWSEKNQQLWRCETDELPHTELVVGGNTSPEGMAAFWGGIRDKTNTIYPPAGTVLVKRIRLVERIA